MQGPSPTRAGTSDAITSGLGSLLSAGSQAADLYPHDNEGLLQILHFKNQKAFASQLRSSWFGGRIYNKLSGELPDYIPLSGTHLRQALSATGVEAPNFVVNAGKYLLRVDISKKAVANLTKKEPSRRMKASGNVNPIGSKLPFLRLTCPSD